MSATPPPLVSIIIAARPGQTEVAALQGCRQLDYPRDRIELLIARGRQPSTQRNTAAQVANGELLYFLDDDSMPRPENLSKAAAHFAQPDVLMVGGPNLCPADAPRLEQAFALVMGSGLAFGPSRARYRTIGEVRPTGEKELILCNLLVRRDVFLEAGGFDEALYPNEENALMDALQRRGGMLLYDPELAVERRPRGSLLGFGKMLLNYGRGRAEQFRLHPTLGSALNFVPPLFVLYLLGLPWLPGWAYWPLAAYGAVLVAQTAALIDRNHPLPVQVIPLIVMTHLLYGLGFWRGLFTQPGRSSRGSPGEVILERIVLSA